MKTVFSISNSYSDRRLLRSVLIASILLLFNSNISLAQFAGGIGTAGDPFQISNVTQLQNIKTASNSAHYILINDIDASATSTWNAGAGFDPTGWFGGNFNGNNFTIYNLTINRPLNSNVGIFSSTGSGSVFRNVTLENFNITGGTGVGALIGTNAGLIENVTVIGGNINGSGNVGGIAGQVNIGGVVTYSSAINLNVTGSADNTGGLVGQLIGGTITLSSFNGGTVNGSNKVGGLVGYSNGSNGSVSNSFAIATVSGINEVGGLLGSNNSSSFSNSYASGSVQGVSRVGGFVGFNGYSGINFSSCFSFSHVNGTGNDVGGFVGRLHNGTIQNTFSRGSVNGANNVGGHTGNQLDGKISNSYSSGQVSGSGSSIGGFMGSKSAGTTANSFWDYQTSNQLTSAQGTAKTTTEMLDINTFTSAGWNFNTIWAIDSDINDGYPYLEFGLSFFTNNWTGAIDTQWELTGNWSGNMLPMPHQNVTIPNVTNQPLISSDVEINALIIAAGSSVTINTNGTLTVNNSIANNNGVSGLVIKSNASGTGSLMHNTDNLNATIERYIPAASYHLVSVPLTQAMNPLSGLFLWSYLFDFDADVQNWTGMDHPTMTPLNNAKGYMIYKYPGPNKWQADTTYTFSGHINNGSFSAFVSFPDKGGNFSLVPNPYPSAIDWNDTTGWTRTNVSGSYWVWNPAYNNYASWNGTVGISGATKDIPGGQGFFVQASGANPVLNMNNNVRLHSSKAFYKSEANDLNMLRLRVSSFGGADEIVLVFDEMATTAFNHQTDAYKLFGGQNAPQIYSISSDNHKLSINNLPLADETTQIVVGFEQGTDGNVTISATDFDLLNESIDILLHDAIAQTTINLRETPQYTFSHSTIHNGADRFTVLLKSATSIHTPELNNVTAFFSNGVLNVELDETTGKHAELRLYGASGRLIHAEAAKPGKTKISLSGLPQGLYMLQVIDGNRQATRKLIYR